MNLIKKTIISLFQKGIKKTLQSTYNKLYAHNKFINQIKLNFYLKINTYSYRRITNLVTKVNNGIHPKHKIINYEKFFLDNIDKNDSVLDVGCHTGRLSAISAQKAKKVIGIDIDKNRILEAKKKHQYNDLTFINDDATTHDFKEKFDKLILSNVLEHIEQRIEFLKKLKPLTKTILIRIPLIERDWLSVYKKDQKIEYRLDPTHYIEYTENQIKEETEKAGWKIKEYSIKFGEFYGILE